MSKLKIFENSMIFMNVLTYPDLSCLFTLGDAPKTSPNVNIRDPSQNKNLTNASITWSIKLNVFMYIIYI